MTFDFPVPLTEKYRPRTVDAFVGLHKPRKILAAFIKQPFDSAWLFHGPSGCGKTTMGLAIAEQLGAELHKIPSKSCDLEKVETVTRICNYGAFNFTTGKAAHWHVVLVDESDSMSDAAQKSFLSKLDSTARPPQTIFIFTANSIVGLEDRFRSRCRVLPFEHESLEDELEAYLRKVYKREGGRFPVNFLDLCKLSGWNVRDAITKLELELMMGANRSDLPPEKELEIIAEHPHRCKKCRRAWKHADEKCGLAYLSACPECGGASTVGQERARKAWKTIEKNAKKGKYKK